MNGEEVQKIAAEVKLNGSPWLSGWPKAVMQLGAAGVVCLLLIIAQLNTHALIREMRSDGREDLEQFRRELKEQREESRESRSRQWQIIRDNTDALREATGKLKKE